MKKIIHINQFAHSFGGLERVLLNRVKFMPKHEHHIFYTRNSIEDYTKNFKTASKVNGSNIDQKIKAVSPHTIIVYNTPKISYKFLKNKRQYKAIKSIHDYDHFFFGGGYNRITYKKKKYSISKLQSLFLHGWSSFRRDPLTRKIYFSNPFSWRSKFLEFNDFDKIEYLADFIKDLLVKNEITRPTLFKNFLWGPLPIQTRRARTKEIKLLFVGNLIRGKGLIFLLKALRNMNIEYNLSVVGQGDLLLKYKKYVKKNDLNVSFLGKIPQTEVYKFMRNADLLLMPSIFEHFGTVAIEAMSQGLPVITFDVGGPTEYIRNSFNGYKISPFCIKTLKSTIEQLGKNREQLETIQENALTFTKNSPYTLDNHVKLLLKNI